MNMISKISSITARRHDHSGKKYALHMRRTQILRLVEELLFVNNITRANFYFRNERTTEIPCVFHDTLTRKSVNISRLHDSI